jgi:hypothetical protein
MATKKNMKRKADALGSKSKSNCFDSETFTKTRTQSNEIEFYSSKSKVPIKIGYVTEGSQLKNSFLAVYMKHRSVWPLKQGVIYIAKQITDDSSLDDDVRSYQNRINEKERYSIILFDPQTFLSTFLNPTPKEHATMTQKKTLALVKAWNQANGNDTAMGQREEVGYHYTLADHSWDNHKGLRYSSRLQMNLSTWAKTRNSNWEANAICSPNDIMVNG